MSSGSLCQEPRSQDISSLMKVTACSPGGAQATVVQETQDKNVTF